jgi:hypothetical protein
MTRLLVRYLALVFALILVGRPARAQSPVEPLTPDTNRSWDALAAHVTAGRKVVVTLVNSTVVEGKVIAIDGHSITIEQGVAVQTIRVDDVCTVRDAGARKRRVVYGMLIGATAGSVMGPAWDRRSAHPSSRAEASVFGAVFIGAPIGAIAGALVPRGAPLFERAFNACR